MVTDRDIDDMRQRLQIYDSLPESDLNLYMLLLDLINAIEDLKDNKRDDVR